MASPIVGLHHVTAIASDPQRNLDFYTQVLGLRLVKRTVNFDDPGTYHFYFGDDAGHPGTLLTFFPWAGAERGERGAGETIATAFSVPPGSFAYWKQRLAAHNVASTEETHFGATYLAFDDPDGMRIELVEHSEAAPSTPPRTSDVPAAYAIQGFYGVTLLQLSLGRSAALLEIMGFAQVGREGDRVRFAPAGDALGRFVDLVIDEKAYPYQMGAGSVHHIAFRAADDAAQLAWREQLGQHVFVTDVRDRTYFHSIYFREPGGVLYEIATDPPGFGVDEPAESLGEALRIPAWLEPHRAQIEQKLAPITLHKANAPAEESK
ncbi:MAG: ring-cleaving dioxygenase [Terracidiphilus sp.]|nr:ring-cleaving dioxygenase [Terracidiphilus sp.]